MSPAPTSHVESVDFVMLYIVGISVILLLGITAVMIYFVFKYHRKKGHKPVDIHGNVLLEIIWIAIPTILVLSMFYFGYTSFRDIRIKPKDAMAVKVTARMWQFSFEYENGKKSDTLYVPINKGIDLQMESVDVNHSLYIPAFRIKEDVIKGKTTNLYFTAEVEGTYDIACAEYCGLDHSMMYSQVKVVSADSFKTWYSTVDSITDSTKTK
ncbi:MAG: cytochrome c oxidase subunit II [Melioribacteraceae bacterium]|jgi:cytochrome c oxidase subunit 2|nr:cytochrome c oxidase subunit II [Melioribacteraceae bacterium]